MKVERRLSPVVGQPGMNQATVHIKRFCCVAFQNHCLRLNRMPKKPGGDFLDACPFCGEALTVVDLTKQ